MGFAICGLAMTEHPHKHIINLLLVSNLMLVLSAFPAVRLRVLAGKKFNDIEVVAAIFYLKIFQIALKILHRINGRSV